jgi:hypothetical protein
VAAGWSSEEEDRWRFEEPLTGDCSRLVIRSDVPRVKLGDAGDVLLLLELTTQVLRQVSFGGPKLQVEHPLLRLLVVVVMMYAAVCVVPCLQAGVSEVGGEFEVTCAWGLVSLAGICSQSAQVGTVCQPPPSLSLAPTHTSHTQRTIAHVPTHWACPAMQMPTTAMNSVGTLNDDRVSRLSASPM